MTLIDLINYVSIVKVCFKVNQSILKFCNLSFLINHNKGIFLRLIFGLKLDDLPIRYQSKETRSTRTPGAFNKHSPKYTSLYATINRNTFPLSHSLEKVYCSSDGSKSAVATSLVVPGMNNRTLQCTNNR